MTRVRVGLARAPIDHGGLAMQVMIGQGDGTFDLLPSVGPWQGGVFGVAIGDLNGDEFADVVAAVAEPDSTGDMHNLLLLSETK